MRVRLLAIGIAALSFSAFATSASPARQSQAEAQPAEVQYLKLDDQLTVRASVARNPRARRSVLLLHGFPETLYAWTDVSLALASDHEVHAFDWPGYGLSSRPTVERFAYSPRDYARVVRQYVEKAGIDRSRLIIYATDIGALPALLAAMEEPGIARAIIVGDFAPFNRPQHMHERLDRLKSRRRPTRRVPNSTPARKTRSRMHSSAAWRPVRNSRFQRSFERTWRKDGIAER